MVFVFIRENPRHLQPSPPAKRAPGQGWLFEPCLRHAISALSRFVWIKRFG